MNYKYTHEWHFAFIECSVNHSWLFHKHYSSLTFGLNDSILYMFVMIRNDSARLSSGISWPHYTGLATAKPIHVLPHQQLLTQIPNRIRIQTQIHIQIFKWLTFVCLVHFFRVIPPPSVYPSVCLDGVAP